MDAFFFAVAVAVDLTPEMLPTCAGEQSACPGARVPQHFVSGLKNLLDRAFVERASEHGLCEPGEVVLEGR
jgi:hypothetical protein